MDLISLGTCLVLLLLLYLLVFVPLRNVVKFRSIPSHETLPILGNVVQMWKFQNEFNKLFERWALQYGTRPVVIWGTYWFPLVILGDARDAKKVLSSRDHVQKGILYKAFDLAIGSGAFNSPVNIWKQRRPHLEQAFHSKVLQRLPQIFDKSSRLLLKALKDGGMDDEQVFDIHPYINLCSIQMLVEGALGVKVDTLGKGESAFWKQANHNYNRGTYLAEFRMLRPWFLLSNFLWELTPHAKEMRKVVGWLHNQLFSKFLDTRRKLLLEDSKDKPSYSYPNFMDLLLLLQDTKTELQLTDEELIYELSSIYIAGHDASGKAMSFVLLFLGFHKECQDKVVEELKEVFGEDNEREVKEDDLTKMRYLECCIKEALRLTPPVSFITRRVGCDVKLEDNTVIPKGAEVAIATYMVHRNPEVYPEPNVFRPERFLPDNCTGRDPYAWIPFSAGPRNCLGPKFAMMEIKILVANILRHYQVESIGSMDEWVLSTNVTLRLKGGWKIRLITRPKY